MSFEFKEKKEWVVIDIQDRLDSFNYSDFKEELSGRVNEGRRQFALNLGQAKFISLPSIKYFCSIADEIHNKGGKFALVGTPEKLKRQIDIFASLESMQIYRSYSDWESQSS